MYFLLLYQPFNIWRYAAVIYEHSSLLCLWSMESMEHLYDDWDSYRKTFPRPFVCSSIPPDYFLLSSSEEKNPGFSVSHRNMAEGWRVYSPKRTTPCYSYLGGPRLGCRGGGLAVVFNDCYKCRGMQTENYSSFEFQTIKVGSTNIFSCVLVCFNIPPGPLLCS